MKRNNFFYILKVIEERSWIRSWIRGSGSTTKCHESPTLLPIRTYKGSKNTASEYIGVETYRCLQFILSQNNAQALI